MPSGRLFNIAIVYPENFPIVSPRLYPIDADSHLPEGVSQVPHRFPDGSLCIHFPSVESPNITGADLAKMAVYWLQTFENFIETGSWGEPSITPKSSEISSQKDIIFISYSHRDTKWLHRLQIHLKTLERENRIDIWNDTKLLAGTIWRQEITRTIESTRVAILLISADFLASDFIQNDELPSLLKKAEQAGTVILPVILSPCRFLETATLAQFQGANPPSKPLSSMTRHEQEKLFVKITRDIETALNRLSEHA